MPAVEVNGIRLNYAVYGDGDPILFVHGLGSSGRDWQMQVDFFASDYRVITVDLRGHGDSDKPRGRYSIAQFANDVAQLLEQTGDAPAHVVGLSLGGMVAMELAVSRPSLVRSLVVVNSGPEMPRATWRQRLRVWWFLFTRTLIVRCCGMRRMGKALASRLLPEQGQRELQRMFIEHWAENLPRAYLASMWALSRWSVVSRLGDIRCPTCVIGAEMDYTPITYKQSYAAQIPRAEVVCIPHSRHLTPVDQPQRFNQALLEFLHRTA
jgi:3-oxoadipate enol-lactonase